FGQGLTGEVAATARAAFVEDLSRAAGPVDRAWVASQGFTSMAALPLVVGAHPVGVFELFTRARYHWHAAEVRLLEAFAEHGALALEKARLFQDTQDRRHLTENLYAVTVAMERTMDVRQRVRTFVRGAAATLGFDRCNVLLATEDGRALELVAGTDQREGD